VFLESGPGGLAVLDKDPHDYTGFELLMVWPWNAILLHLTVVGVLFCCMVFPIFGRPRELSEDAPTDFGKHVRALGELLSRTGDRQYAVRRVQQYRQIVTREGGAGGSPPTETGSPFGTQVRNARH
jgi:hypothetical protein